MLGHGDTVVVTKLDRLDRSLPDARAIAVHSTGEVADLFGVSRPTVYRALQRSRSATTA